MKFIHFAIIAIVAAALSVTACYAKLPSNPETDAKARRLFHEFIARNGHGAAVTSMASRGSTLQINVTDGTLKEYFSHENPEESSEHWIYNRRQLPMPAFFRFAWEDAYAQAYQQNKLNVRVSVEIRDPHGRPVVTSTTPLNVP